MQPAVKTLQILFWILPSDFLGKKLSHEKREIRYGNRAQDECDCMRVGKEMEKFLQEGGNRTADDNAEQYACERDADLYDGEDILRRFYNRQSSNCIFIAVIGELFQTTLVAFCDGGFRQGKKTACRYEENGQKDQQRQIWTIQEGTPSFVEYKSDTPIIPYCGKSYPCFRKD